MAMSKPSIVVWLQTTLLVASILSTRAIRSNLHPLCGTGPTARPIFVEDVTALLHGTILPASVCVFNPSVTHLQDDLFLWSARAYIPSDPQYACVANYQKQLPLLTKEKWLGQNSLVLAVTRTVWAGGERTKHDLVAVAQFDVPLEDGRLFRDEQDTLWLLAHCPRGSSMAVVQVTANCSTPTTAGGPQPASAAKTGTSCSLGVGATKLLPYKKMIKVEKNWVPHHRSTRMSYPVYPSFTPHTVLDWGSYHSPAFLTPRETVGGLEPFFVAMNATYGRLLEFSGSTPALLSSDGGSYMAVGHIRALASCFHGPDSPGGGSGVSATCAARAARMERRHRPLRAEDLRYLDVRHSDGGLHAHHFKEYAMFLYRFSSTPPYDVTHISHAFMPCSGAHHSGIVYPAGLVPFGPAGRDFLIAYGDSNRYSRLMVMTGATVEALLRPIAEMSRRINSYSLCTLQCTGTLR